MNIINYILKKKKVYVGTTAIVFIFGFVLVLWGIDVDQNQIKNTILVSVGTSLIAGGITAVLDLFKNINKDKIYQNLDRVILQAGIEDVYKKRDLDEYDELINSSKESIDVMGYSLRGFFQSYKDILVDKAKKNSNFKVRILLVNPDSEFSKWREENEDGKEFGTYKKSLNVIQTGFEASPNIEIRLIDAPLSYMIYRIDNVMYVGPYFYGKSSKSTNTIKLDKEGWLFQEYKLEFEHMWEAGEVGYN